MKNVIMGLTVLLLGSNVFAKVSVNDLLGTYVVTSELLPAIYEITVEKDIVRSTERTPYSSLNCSGPFELTGSIVTSTLNCENGTSWIQVINLEGVDLKNNQFVAIVSSSLFDFMQFPMNFTRVKSDWPLNYNYNYVEDPVGDLARLRALLSGMPSWGDGAAIARAIARLEDRLGITQKREEEKQKKQREKRNSQFEFAFN